MKTLTQILKDQSLDQFLNKNFTRLPFSSQGGAAGLTSLLHWEVVAEILEKKKSILRIVKDGKMTKDYADLSYLEAKDFYKQGHTLLVKNAELSDDRLKNLADDFSKGFHTEVDIQLYCTPENNNAFGWHYDVEEVFIVQAKGSKLYSIRQNTIHPYPLVSSIPKNLKYEDEKSDVEIKVLLKEGDWLYIPSGWWHIARTQEESMHISIGLMPRAAVDLASHLATYLAQFPFWRTRLPIHKEFASHEEEKVFYQDAFKTLGKDLEKKVNEPQFLEDFLIQMKKKHSNT